LHSIVAIALRIPAMEAVVPQEITTELTQILANLVLGDNKIRSKCAIFTIDTTSIAETSIVLNRRLMIDSPRHQTSTSSHWLNFLLQLIRKWQVHLSVFCGHSYTQATSDAILFTCPASPTSLPSCTRSAFQRRTTSNALRPAPNARLDHPRAFATPLFIS